MERVAFAHTLRGLAAASVLVAHLVGVFWINPKAVAVFINSLGAHPLSDPVTWLTTLVKPFAQIGVAVFFLVSGFVIPFSIERYSTRGFIVARLVRIWPLYIVGFSFTLAMYELSSSYFRNPFGYDGWTVAVNYMLGLRDVLWVASIDGIVWTLEIELKFYLLCALMAGIIRRAHIAPVLMISALLVAINLSFAPWREHFLATNLVVYTKMMTFCLSATFLPFMFLGTLFHSLHKGAITLKTFAVASAVLWGAFMLGAFLGAWSQGDGRTVPLFYSMAWGIFALFYFRLGAWQNAVTRFLGNVSYPLYVVHGLAGYVIIAILIDKGVPAAAATGLAAAAVIAVAWMLHKAVELPTMRLASAMARHMSVEAPTRRPEAAAPEWTGAGPQLPPGTTTVVLFPRRPL